MRTTTAALIGLSLAACATTEPGYIPERHTTTVSVATADGGIRTIFLRTAAEDGARTGRIAAPADAVWQAVAVAYEELGIPLETIDPATRRIGNASFVRSRQLGGRPLSAYLACGYDATGTPVADSHRLQLHVMSEVVGHGEETDFSILVRAVALPGAASTTRIPCRTTGALEQRIANTVALNAAR
jgi:hypothetical protein